MVPSANDSIKEEPGAAGTGRARPPKRHLAAGRRAGGVVGEAGRIEKPQEIGSRKARTRAGRVGRVLMKGGGQGRRMEQPRARAPDPVGKVARPDGLPAPSSCIIFGYSPTIASTCTGGR